MPNKTKRRSKGQEFFDAQPNSLRDSSRYPTCLITPQDLKEISAIGEGFYANVVLGQWTRPNKKEEFVAIKSIKDGIIQGHLEDILREADTMIHLQHDNIIRLYGISLITNKHPMGIKLVTEYATFGSLQHVLQKKDKPEFLQVTRLWKFAGQIAEGMEYLAKQGLVHRDLAARNVLVVEPELVRISDFGLAKALNQGQNMTPGREMAIAWCAPEVIQVQRITNKCDVWSYGVLLWEMFSFGKTPWEGIPFMKVMQIATTQPDRRLDQPRACSPEFYELMLSCWQQDPELRPDFSEIHSVIMRIEPATGVAKETLRVSSVDKLSFIRNTIVTVISKSDVLPWKGQNEDGKVGLFQPRDVDFDKNAQIKSSKDKKKGITKLVISQPYNPSVKTTAQILDDMNIPEDHQMQIRNMIRAQRKSEEKIIEEEEDKAEMQWTLPRPEPIGMLREDPRNGYLLMDDGLEPNEQLPNEELPRGDRGLPKIGNGKDGSILPASDMQDGDNYARAPPAIPERTDLKVATPAEHIGIKQTPPATPANHTNDPQTMGTRRRPVPTPRNRKDRLQKTLSTPTVLWGFPQPRDRAQSHPDWLGLQRESDEVSLSDSEADHPSLVPLLGPSTSAPDHVFRGYLGAYGLLGDGRDSSEDELETKRGDSFDNKGYGQVILMENIEGTAETPDEQSREKDLVHSEQAFCYDNEDYFRLDRLKGINTIGKDIRDTSFATDEPLYMNKDTVDVEKEREKTIPASEDPGLLEPVYMNRDPVDAHKGRENTIPASEDLGFLEPVYMNRDPILTDKERENTFPAAGDAGLLGPVYENKDAMYPENTYENGKAFDSNIRDEIPGNEEEDEEELGDYEYLSACTGFKLDSGNDNTTTGDAAVPPLPEKHGTISSRPVTEKGTFVNNIEPPIDEVENSSKPPPLPFKHNSIPRNITGHSAAVHNFQPHWPSLPSSPHAGTREGPHESMEGPHESMEGQLISDPFYESIAEANASSANTMHGQLTETWRHDASIAGTVAGLSSSFDDNMSQTNDEGAAPPPLPGKDILSRDVSSIAATLPRPLCPLPDEIDRGTHGLPVGLAASQDQRFTAPNGSSHPTQTMTQRLLDLGYAYDSTTTRGPYSPHHHGARFEARPYENVKGVAPKSPYQKVLPDLPPPPFIDPAILHQPAPGSPPQRHETVTASDLLLASIGLGPADTQHSSAAAVNFSGNAVTGNRSISNDDTRMSSEIAPTQQQSDYTSDYRHTSWDPWERLEGTHGDDMRRIHNDLPLLSFEECEAAMLRHQGDTVAVVKVSNVCSLTGASADEAEFHLGHCGWDVQRTVNYIFDKMT